MCYLPVGGFFFLFKQKRGVANMYLFVILADINWTLVRLVSDFITLV